MTKPEFIQGFALLTVQPWGKVYRGTSPEALIQVDFYYRHISKANPRIWLKVCEEMSAGERWPSLNELKTALKQHGGWELDGQHQLTHQPEFIECPAEIRAQLARLGVRA